MHIFLWEGINAHGMKEKGEKEAVDKLAAVALLRQADITVLRIKKRPSSTLFPIGKSISTQDIASFTKEFSNLISANLPLTDALEMLGKGAHKPKLKQMIGHIGQQVNAGKSLSSALSYYAPYFDHTFCSLIAAGECSGKLALMLKNITQYQEKSLKLKRIVKKALLYPLTVLTVSLMVTTVLLVFIVPQFADLFQQVGAELPMLTRMIIALSSIIYRHGDIFLYFIFSFLIATKIGLPKCEKCLAFLDSILLKIPVFGYILKQSILARSFHTLSVLLHAGISLTEALFLAARVSHHRVYQKAFHAISDKVSAGHAMHVATKNTDRFPEVVIHMIAMGENTGTLDQVLHNLGNYFEERVDDIIHHIGQLLEPIIMIFLCLIVGVVVVAMYLPIFNIGTVI